MNIAILTFDGFNELDSFIAAGILNRMRSEAWNVQICCPSEFVTSMNGVKIFAQQALEFANTADAVLFGSGMLTRDIAKNQAILSRIKLNPTKQLIAGQCSGALLMSALGLLHGLPACTDLTTKPWLVESGVEVINQAFYAKNQLATAGGCLSSQYLAAWVIAKLAGQSACEAAINYVAPVGEKEQTFEHCWSVISPYI
ncbi:AraC family transcriptional regulator [Alginatibacterium sediminis]|uniref:AraC family transcriptional regulator n=1 Tax=Alginatibacterium sediminis TaxID=2164068 RepID=A0A420EI44_9ALTE|nr:DJ-1/PfpI family protein [Alginatibacterium sediminis]RKF20348.1 AraC family transcriptional regulator [Alginatibacterium sediminis]